MCPMRRCTRCSRSRAAGRSTRGEIVFHRGDPADSLNLIRKGRFSVRIVTPLGDTAMLSVRGPGDAFGELALLGREPVRSATVSALEPAETYSVHRDDFERLRHEHPIVNDVLDRHPHRPPAQALGPARRGVLRARRPQSASSDVRAGRAVQSGDGEVVVPLTQEEIAELAGTSRATVNRVLREAERRGSVELRRGRTAVLDLDQLLRRGG